MANYTNSDIIANTPITLELADGYTVEMYQLTIQQNADLDAYARGKFIQNTLKAVEHVDAVFKDKVIQNMTLAAQQMIWSDKAATTIFNTEDDGLAYYTYQYVKKSYPEDFNSWKERFNAHREENMKLFLATRYVLYFSAAAVANPNIGWDKDPEGIYKMIDQALKAKLALDTILELTPAQVNMLIGDRDKIAAVNDGKLHFRDQDEFRAWHEARQKEQESAT